MFFIACSSPTESENSESDDQSAVWVQKESMPTARWAHASCELNGKIYAIGGSNTTDDDAFKTLEVYDPVLNTWTSKTDMRTIRAHFATYVLNGKVYAVGGGGSFYSGSNNAIEEYDPATDTWTEKNNMPRARMGHTASVVNGKVYIIGGADASEMPIAEVDIYDPATNTWTTGANIPTPRYNLAVAVLNEKIYAMGGHISSPWVGLYTVEEYNPATNMWTTKAPMGTGRRYFMACALSGKIYVFGGSVGYDIPTILSSVEEYDPVTDTWTPKTGMPSDLGAASAASFDGKIYISGGSPIYGPSVTDIMYEYEPGLDSSNNQTVTDIDGNIYKTVTVGEQVWIDENLKVTHFRNGDAIENVTNNTEWSNLSSGAYCSYDNDNNNVNIYGLLYNWYAVNDNRNIAPTGWHVPTDEEWKQLEMYLGMSQSEADGIGLRGTDEGGKLKEAGTTHWNSPNTGATNSSGFSAFPRGNRHFNGSYIYYGVAAYLWSATEGSSGHAWLRYLDNVKSNIGRYDYDKRSGFSVRCIKGEVAQNNTIPTASFTNEDESSALEVRWDWENDGTYDTNYSITKTATYQYNTVGTYTVKLEVKDTEGLTNTTTVQIIVSSGGGNVYQTVQIGNQIWMAENLKTTHYSNGDAIPNVTDNTEWSNLTTGAYCSYNNNDSNINTYGLLYNWYAVNDSRNIAPEGWHIPTDEEWKQLEMFLGMSQGWADAIGSRGTDEGGKLKEAGTTHWSSPNTGATNSSGFSSVPGGSRHYGGACYDYGYTAYFWSTTEYSSNTALYRALGYLRSDVGRHNNDKRSGFSVRCIKD